MGCGTSLLNPLLSVNNGKSKASMKEITFDDSHCGTISPAERELVMDTWYIMTDDMTSNGLQVFLRIFDVCPAAKKLFKIENVRQRDVAHNPIIRVHGSRFMQAIGAAVDRLSDAHLNNSDDLDQLLLILGHQHKQHDGFQPRYFDVFYEALMWHWERKMGEKFTPEVGKAWSHVFVYLMLKLKEGYMSDIEKDNTVAPPRNDKHSTSSFPA